MKTKGNSKIPNRALSVRQPFAEQIMQGTKRIEYRSILTNIRGRVYIYASKAPAKWAYEKMGKQPGDYPIGVIVGTVEITSPDNQGQPVWFKPFKKD